MKRRLLSIFCALCLCLTLLPTAAFAEELETPAPALLGGEDGTTYATPSTEDGWTASGTIWELYTSKHYDTPFYSDRSIVVYQGATLEAPDMKVDGTVEIDRGILSCSGTLQASELRVAETAGVGTLSCSQVTVKSFANLTVTTKWNCSGTVNVDENSTLYLPAGTEPNWENFSGAGTVQIGGMAYDTAGNEQGTAMLILTSGASASGEGYTWDGETCTLTLDGFTRTYGENADGSIGIMAEGEDVTLVLKGDNIMSGLGDDAVGITCVGSSLTLKGAGSLDCEGSAGALAINGGSLALAEGYSLNEEADIFNVTSGAGGMVIQAGTAETDPIPATSFTIQSEQSGDGTGSYSAEVKGTYQAGGSGAVVYSVDIAWTDMNFTYTGAGEGTWNPETHQYEGGTEASWTDSNASVTVINHSNAAVTVTASFEALPGYETTSMTFGNNGATVATAEGTEFAKAPSATITITPTGSLAQTANGGKIGTITVSIAAAE